MNLKKNLTGFLKFILPLGLGIFLIVYIYKGFTPEERKEIFSALKGADYSWVVLSIFLGILSHLSRAHRWLILLRTMNYQARLAPAMYSVMIGYLANLAFPRLGEVSRCGAMAKAENIPFQKLFGTVIAERVIDMIILLSITATAFYLERDILSGFVSEKITGPLYDKLFSGVSLLGWLAIILVLGVIGLLVLRFVLPTVLLKIKNFMTGVAEGFKSVLRVKNPFLFIAHSLFIWLMYFLMYRVVFYSLGDVENASLHAVLASFVSGSFGIIATQGGIGAYQGLVAATLVLYGVDFPDGYAFAWIAWTGQLVMILLAGFFSLIALPLLGKGNVTNGNINSEQSSTDSVPR